MVTPKRKAPGPAPASSTPLEVVLAALRAHGNEPRRAGDGYSAPCPAHDDANPSLSVAVGDKGGALVYCHAGCPPEAVADALGLTLADLCPPAADRNGEGRRIVARYPYRNRDGSLRYEVVRYHPKDFRQRRPDGAGGWVWNLRGVGRVLYNLPEVAAAVAEDRRVWLVEGEKDADALTQLGEVATTVPAGAGKWRPDYATEFAGATVTVVADDDDPGRAHALACAEAIVGLAKQVTVVESDRANDTAEHFARGGRLADFRPVPWWPRQNTPLGSATKALKATKGGLWSPRSLSSQPDSPPWPVLDPCALRGLAGEVVSALSPHTEADPAGLLADFLVAFGNVVGAGPHAVADAADHPARLNAVLVGETAKARKGTARANVRAVLDPADTRWATGRVRSGVGSGEGLIAAVAEDDGKDRRLLVIEPEFARLLQVAERNGSTVSPIVRDAWDTGRLSTITRASPLRVDGAHISVLGHVTVEELRRRLTATEVANGFANRFLFVCVRRTRLLPQGGSLPATERAGLSRQVADAITAARKIGLVVRTAGAEALWAEMYAEMAEDDPGGLVGHATARAEAQTLRLSLTYALADGQRQIDVAHLEAGYALWRYCRDSAAYIFGDSLGDEVADQLLTALRAAGPDGLDGTAQRDLFGRHTAGARIAAARVLLAERGLAHTVTEPTDGRPRIVTYHADYQPGGDPP